MKTSAMAPILMVSLVLLLGIEQSRSFGFVEVSRRSAGTKLITTTTSKSRSPHCPAFGLSSSQLKAALEETSSKSEDSEDTPAETTGTYKNDWESPEQEMINRAGQTFVDSIVVSLVLHRRRYYHQVTP